MDSIITKIPSAYFIFIPHDDNNGGRWINLATVTNVVAYPVKSRSELPEIRIDFADTATLSVGGAAAEQVLEEIEDLHNRFHKPIWTQPVSSEATLIQLIGSLQSSIDSVCLAFEQIELIQNPKTANVNPYCSALLLSIKQKLNQISEILGIEPQANTTHRAKPTGDLLEIDTEE